MREEIFESSMMTEGRLLEKSSSDGKLRKENIDESGI